MATELEFAEAEPFNNGRSAPRTPVPENVAAAVKASHTDGKPRQAVLPRDAAAQLQRDLYRAGRHADLTVRVELSYRPNKAKPPVEIKSVKELAKLPATAEVTVKFGAKDKGKPRNRTATQSVAQPTA